MACRVVLFAEARLREIGSSAVRLVRNAAASDSNEVLRMTEQVGEKTQVMQNKVRIMLDLN